MFGTASIVGSPSKVNHTRRGIARATIDSKPIKSGIDDSQSVIQNSARSAGSDRNDQTGGRVCLFYLECLPLHNLLKAFTMTLFQIYYADTSKIKGAEVKNEQRTAALDFGIFFYK
jgi:hypothetical protein